MFCEDIVHKNVERSNDQAAIVVRVNTDQWNLTATTTEDSIHSLDIITVC